MSLFARALLDTIASSESPGYDVMYGGRRFADFTDHPRVYVPITRGPNAGKKSSAAGRYQFLADTWDAVKGRIGLSDFSPESQDIAALDLAYRTYKDKTGRNLLEDLETGGDRAIDRVGKTLSGVWTSLPGGIEQNSQTGGFVEKFKRNLAKLSPVSEASAADIPQGSGVMGSFNPAEYGLVPDDEPSTGFDPAEYGLIPDDAPDDERALFDRMTSEQEANGGSRKMAAWPEPPTGGLGDFLSGAAGSLVNQGRGMVQGLQSAGKAMGMGDNPAFASMPLLSDEKLALLGATLKRPTETGELGELAGDLAPYFALPPGLAIPFAAAATPGDTGDRLGAAAGAAAGMGLGYGAARAVRGFTPSTAARTLMDEGITPTVGQGIEQGILGRAIRRGEEATTSLPLAGATTRGARSRAAEQWTNAVFGRAEGEVMPGLVISAEGRQGAEGVRALRQSFNRAYDTVLDGQFVPIDQRVGAAIDRAIDDPNLFINPEGREWAKRLVASQVSAMQAEGGAAPATAMKRLGDELAAKGASMLKSQTQQERDIGRALMEAEGIISQHIESSIPPELQGVVAQIDKRYANFKRIQRAAAQARDAEGHFTPAELHRSVRMLDTSHDKARFAEGAALLQDLSSAGKSVIPETLGESGTTPRALMAQVMKGGAAEAATGVVGGLPLYGSLAGLMYGGSREPIQRALLGGYGWQQPTSEALRNWLPRLGAGLGYDFSQ